jgi:hypothetical protein
LQCVASGSIAFVLNLADSAVLEVFFEGGYFGSQQVIADVK